MSRPFTNSEIQTFKQCKRKWWLGYYRQLGMPQPETAGPRALGTRIHSALAAWYSSEPVDPRAVLEATIAEDADRCGDDVERLADLMKEADLARAMLDGYLEWLEETGADQGLKVIADEQKVEVPSAIEGVTLMGKLDVRVVRELDGARLFLDHKTVGSFTEATKMLHMDQQMLHYHLLEFLQAMADGQDAEEAIVCDGGIYNMLRKVKRTARATPPFYERAEIRHNRHALRSYYVQVHGVIREILELEQRLAGGEDHKHCCYPTPTRDCTWRCDFFAVCSMLDDGSDGERMLDELYVHLDPHARYATQDEGQEDA